MKRLTMRSTVLAMTLVCGPMVALAGEAGSAASAGATGWGSGTASADAYYHGGGPGIAKTKTKTGKINFARGFAIGVDENGLSLSVSHAVAPRFGPGAAGTFNLTLGRDGSVSSSHGLSVAGGSPNKTVSAGGYAGSGRFGSTAAASADGRTWPGGWVKARTESRDRRPLLLLRGRR